MLRTLTAEEKEARDRALADLRLRDAEERRESEERKRQEEESRKKRDGEERERKDREAAARRKADEETRHRHEEEAKRKAEETAKKLAPKVPAQTAETEEAPVRVSRVKRELKAPPAPAKTKAEAEKRRGKLTLSNALSEEDERNRSVAAFRRRTERLKKQAQGFQKPTEKFSREVIIPEAITIQELSNRMAERAVDIIKLLMKQGQMHTINDVIDADTAQIITEEMGHRAQARGGIGRGRRPVGRHRQRGIASVAPAGRHHHGPCRSRQDLAARRHPQDQCRVGRSGRHHPAYRRLPGRD